MDREQQLRDLLKSYRYGYKLDKTIQSFDAETQEWFAYYIVHCVQIPIIYCGELLIYPSHMSVQVDEYTRDVILPLFHFDRGLFEDARKRASCAT